jgi:hypothetical protein
VKIQFVEFDHLNLAKMRIELLEDYLWAKSKNYLQKQNQVLIKLEIATVAKILFDYSIHIIIFIVIAIIIAY